jgi:hypothetical protein
MAKGDKTDVAKAKSAAANNRKAGFKAYGSTPKAGRKMLESKAKTFNKVISGRAKSGTAENTSRDFVTSKGKEVKTPKLNAKTYASTNKVVSKGTNSISATKPSVASKANAKNKMKAQGAKIGSSATSGYGKTTKK